MEQNAYHDIPNQCYGICGKMIQFASLCVIPVLVSAKDWRHMTGSVAIIWPSRKTSKADDGCSMGIHNSGGWGVACNCQQGSWRVC